MKAWHFLRDDGRAQHGLLGVIEVGKTYKVKGKPIPCYHGLHASTRLIDALDYAGGSLLCRVEMGGEIAKDSDKVCAQERTVIWMMDISTILHNFACNEAERAMLAQKTQDPRSMEAIRIKRLWIKGKATDAELDAARAASRVSEWAAANASARFAASAAPSAAARDASSAAASALASASARFAASASASAAEWAAGSAAASAGQNARLTAMVMRARRKQHE